MQESPVVFLVSHDAPGGVQEIWIDLAQGFKAAGHDVQLMALYPQTLPGNVVAQGLQWQPVSKIRPSSPLQAAKLILELARTFRRVRPAMVFAAMPAANVIAPLAASIAGVGTRVCVSHHSPVSTHQRVLNILDGFTGTLPCTRSIVSVSDAVGMSLEGKPGSYRRKRCTIHNALPPQVEARLQMLSDLRAAQPRRSGRVVAIGRLAEQKNYPVLLRAAAYLPDAEVVIVGTGPLEPCLKQLASSLDVASRVRFLGQLTREATMEVLAGADVFVQPSLFEGHSLALLEAAKLGVPLVVSDVASQIEGVTRSDGTRCGIVVGVHDESALAAALQMLLGSRACHQQWADAAARLSEDATYNKMLTSYRRLIAS